MCVLMSKVLNDLIYIYFILGLFRGSRKRGFKITPEVYIQHAVGNVEKIELILTF